MRINLICPSCDPRTEGQFVVDVQPKNECTYEFRCPNGHLFDANVLYHEFQKLFEVAVNALADNYYREAVGSFAASYERFMELFIRVAMRADDIGESEIEEMWKDVARQSERQLGAFIAIFLLTFGIQPPLLASKQIELRNKVVHQGYFPTKEECLKYGTAVLTSIRKAIKVMYASQRHRDELVKALNDQGDFSPNGPRLHYYAYALIGTNRAPSEDTKTLDEMLEHVVLARHLPQQPA